MKLSVTKKLYIGFALAILFVSLIGISSYKTFLAQATQQEWVEHSYKVINTIQEFQLHVYEMRFNARTFVNTRDSGFLKRWNNETATIDAQILQIENLVSDNPQQRDRVGKLKADVEDLIDYLRFSFSKAIPLSQEDITSMNSTMEPKREAVQRDFSIITIEENKLLDKRHKENQELLKSAIKVLVIDILVTLAIIFILIFFIYNEGRRRQRAEAEIQSNLETLTQLNATANQKNWQLTGLTQLNAALQGESTVTALCESVLKSILQYLELPAGAFYTVIDDVKGLHLLYSIGTTDNVEKTFSGRHSLAAHVLDKKEIVIIKNIPNDYWSIESALGKKQSGEIAYVPLIENGNIVGIIELATFKTFSAEQINFLQVASKSIVIALQSALTGRKVKNLLEHLAQQKDELINQQEELYKTNEELSRQTEVLQRSEEELRAQEEELRKTNDELLQKNEAIELARQTLTLKNKELELASRYKSEFLANMSHELRTPLNSILILGKQFIENKSNNLTDKQIEYAKIIHKSGSDLLELINDMLDLARIEAGKVELHIEDVGTKDIEDDIKQLFSVVAKEKQINFVTSIEQDVPEIIQTDRQRVEQIVKNLLSNAFKFTPKGGEVKLTFSAIDDGNQMLSIAVKDTGIGIPREKQQLIFEAFQQADGSTNRRYGGTGLGLSISRELIRMLGGEIDVQSKEGVGSTFTIHLPLSASVSKQLTVKEPEEDLAAFASKHAPIHQKVSDDRDTIRKNEKVVLIIEDDVQFASLLRDFAREHHYKAIIAVQGDEGLILAKRHKPDAIILDIKLPVIDGWTVLRLLKDDEAVKHIPVHVITGMEYNVAAEGNIVSFLRKPVDKHDIENAFESLMENTLKRFKKLAILSGEHLNDDSLKKLIEKRNFDVECTYVDSVDEIFSELNGHSFDSIIADVGKDLVKAKQDLRKLKEGISDYNIPVIVYLDADISQSDELELMKLSDVVIRDAEMSKNRLMDELELFLYKIRENEKEEAPPPADVEHDKILDDKKVLLVDDDMRNVFVLTNILEEHKMEVTPAVNGKDAIDELKKNRNFDIVLMDIMMPEMDGYEAMQKIRNELRLHLPIIALTAKAMPGDREKCIEAGASDYISKPVDINKLISLMRVWLAQ